MEPKFETKSAFDIIGLQIRGANNNGECPQLWNDFIKVVHEVKPLASTPIKAYGVCSDFDMQNNIFTYTVGLEVQDLSIIPLNMITLHIPKNEYAVFECTLPTLMQTLHDIHKNWLPNSPYMQGNNPEFEYYDTDFDPENPESKMYLYIPIIKK